MIHKERIIGQVKRVNGPVIIAMGVTDAMMLELVHVGEVRLVGEVIKLEGDNAVIQVYEDTTGIAPGDNIYGSAMSISVELGPGLIGTIYDGIQRPLEEIYSISDQYIERGIRLSSLNREKKWHFIPNKIKPDTYLTQGQSIGTIQETISILHKILVPPHTEGELVSLVPEGDYTVEEPVGLLKTSTGEEKLFLMHKWPIRQPRPVINRILPEIPLITGQRVLDSGPGNHLPSMPLLNGAMQM